MRALVLGVGRMGKAIAYAMDKFGFHVVGMDTNPKAADNIPEKVNFEDGKTLKNEFFIVDDADDICRGIETQEKPDIVISSLPYHQTEIVGKWCIDNAIRYCDLGGRVDVSQNINTHAKENATKPIFTDLGLAPGWVNILAEQGCKEIHTPIDSVKMMVGGLPSIKTNPPLNYAVTWSIDGLINEYKDDCTVLENGEVNTVPGMSGLEGVSFDLLEGEELEAFYTSGGASHSIPIMKKRGVKDCSYKTIRYSGHRDAVQFLIDRAELSKECLNQVFEGGCGKSMGDIVLIKVEVKGGNLTWNKEIVVGYDPRFSAMQKSTAFSISSIAALMAEGVFDNRKIQNRSGDIKLPVVLNYSDVPFDKFNDNLRKLGIQV
jgi:saccharopine dehydrogenase-like NADP-dependent oxidoreductase